MKKSWKYWIVIAMVLFGVTLLVSGNAAAVIVAPQPSAMAISSASPVFGSGISSNVVVVRPFGFGFPFFHPFFNPFFFDVDPFFFD